MFGLNKRKEDTGVVGVFEHIDVLEEAVRKAQDQKLPIGDVYSPVPLEGINDMVIPGPSPIRFFTGSGAVFGLVGGFALAIITSLIWNLVVGGKPVTNHVPFVVVGFELMILCGAIFTLLGLLAFAKLPNTQFPTKAYREMFSKDRFGLWLACETEGVDKATLFLKEMGALDVMPVGGGSEESAP